MLRWEDDTIDFVKDVGLRNLPPQDLDIMLQHRGIATTRHRYRWPNPVCQ